MPYDPWEGLDAQLAGLEEPQPSFWTRHVAQPMESVFGFTQGLVPKVLLGGTEAYAQAKKELEQQTGEQDAWRATPGAGNVAAAALGLEPGLAKMGTELVGNIVLDPTTWIPGALIGRGARIAARGIEAATTAGKLSEEAAKAVAAYQKVRGIKEAGEALKAIGDPNLLRAWQIATFGGLGANAGIASVAGMAFAPSVGAGFLEAGKAALQKAKEGELGEAAASAGAAALMGGLGYLTARGVMSPFEAGKIFRTHMAEKAPVVAPLLKANADEAAAAELPFLRPQPPPLLHGAPEAPPLAPLGLPSLEDVAPVLRQPMTEEELGGLLTAQRGFGEYPGQAPTLFPEELGARAYPELPPELPVEAAQPPVLEGQLPIAWPPGRPRIIRGLPAGWGEFPEPPPNLPPPTPPAPPPPTPPPTAAAIAPTPTEVPKPKKLRIEPTIHAAAEPPAGEAVAAAPPAPAGAAPAGPENLPTTETAKPKPKRAADVALEDPEERKRIDAIIAGLEAQGYTSPSTRIVDGKEVKVPREKFRKLVPDEADRALVHRGWGGKRAAARPAAAVEPPAPAPTLEDQLRASLVARGAEPVVPAGKIAPEAPDTSDAALLGLAPEAAKPAPAAHPEEVERALAKLGYTPNEWAAMTDEEAAATIRERRYPPNAPGGEPVPPAAPTRAEVTAGKVADIQARRAAIKERMAKRRGGTLTTGIDPAEFRDLVELGGTYLEEGVVRFADWSARMIEDAGDWVKPHLPRVFQSAGGKLEVPRITIPEGGFPQVEVPTAVPKQLVLPERPAKAAKPVEKAPPAPAAEGELSDLDRKAGEEFAKEAAPVRWTLGKQVAEELSEETGNKVYVGGQWANRGVPAEDLPHLVSGAIEKAGRNPEWRALSTVEEKVASLRGYMKNEVRAYFRDKMTERGRQGPIERPVGEEGETEEVLSTETVPAGGPEPGIKRLSEAESVEHEETARDLATHVQGVAERKFPGQGNRAFESYLRGVPQEVLRGKKASGKWILSDGLDTVRKKLGLVHAASTAYGDPSAEFVRMTAKANGYPWKLRDAEVSELKARYREIISANEEFKIPDTAEEEAAKRKFLLSKERAQFREPDIYFGIRPTEGSVEVGWAPGTQARLQVPKGRAATEVQGEQIVRLGGGREQVETTQGRLTGRGEYEGVWADFGRNDTPNAGSRMVWDPESRLALPTEATSIEITRSGGDDPVKLAGVLRQALKANPSIGEVTARLAQTEAGPAAVNPTIEKALAILEKEGVLKRRAPAVVELGTSRNPLMQVGPGPAEQMVDQLFDRVVQGGPPAGSQEITRLRDRARALRARAKGIEVARVPGEGPTISTYPRVGGKDALKLADELDRRADQLVREGAGVRKTQPAGVKAERVLAYKDQLVRKWIADYQREHGIQRRPAVRVYERPGAERPIQDLLANSMATADEDLSEDLRLLRLADDFDKTDAPTRVGGVTLANVDGAHAQGDLERLAAAHAPLLYQLRRVSDAIHELAGVGGRLDGFIATPWRNALVRGAIERGEGGTYLNPSMAYYVGRTEGTGLRGAAEHLINSQIVHEASHLVEQSAKEGVPITDTMQRLVDLVKAVDGRYEEMVDQLSKPELWKGLEGEAPGFRRMVEEARGGRLREGWRGAEVGVGELRPGAPEGGLAAAPYRGREGPYGAAAGGGLGLQPGEAVPGGGGGPAGGVGHPAAPGRGGYPGGAGDRTLAVAFRGAAGRPEDQIASSRVDTWRDSMKHLSDTADLSGRPASVQEDEIARRVSAASKLLQQAKDAGDADAAEEWKKRLVAGPSPKATSFSEGSRLYSLVNANWDDLPERAKVNFSLWTEAILATPEQARRFASQRPVTFDSMTEAAKRYLDINSADDFLRRIKGNNKLTEVDAAIGHILTHDLWGQANEADVRLDDALVELGRLQAAGQTEAADRFNAETVGPLDRAREKAWGNTHMIADLVSETGTTQARGLAYRRTIALQQNPDAQLRGRLRGGLFEMLQGKYPDRRELRSVVGTLMKLYDRKRLEPDFVEKGSVEWWDAVRRSMKMGKLDKVLEWYKAGLLGWPSRIANISSNGLFAGWREVEKDLAGAIEHGLATFHGEKPERFAEEFLLKKRILRRWLSGGMGAWTRANMDAFALRPLELTKLGISNEIMEDFIRMPGAISGKKGEFVRFMFKTLNADDALFKHLSKVDSYYREAYRSLKRGVVGWEKRPGESIWDATERYVQDIEDNVKGYLDSNKALDPRYQKIYERANELAQEETYQKALGAAAAAGQRGLHEGAGRLLQFILPFYRTPINIAKEAVYRTPLDLPRVAFKWSGMSHAEKVDAAARHALSAAVAGGLWALMEGSGLEISGNGPVDPEANQLMKESGWAPYSIKLGDKWYSYQRLEPLASVLGMLADAHEGWKQGDYEKVGTGVQRAVGTITQNLTSKTFLSGLENLTNMMSDPLRYGEQWAKQTVAGAVPNTVGYVPFGHLARDIDPVYREVQLGGPVGVGDILVSKVPWLSRTLAPQYAPTGEERQRPEVVGGARTVSPFQVTTEKKTPEAQAARMLAQIGFPMRRVRPQVTWKGLKVDITPDEMKQLAKAQASALAFIGQRLMRDPTFLELPNNDDEAAFPGQKTKKDVLERVVNRYRRPVMAQLQPQLRQRASAYLKGRQEEERVGQLGP